MQVCSLLEINDQTIHCQFFSDEGKTRNVVECLWEDVSKVEVFKRDMLTYDLICLVVKLSNGQSLEVDEEDALWGNLIQEIPARLHGTVPFSEWFMDVAFPAFEANTKVVYRKK